MSEPIWCNIRVRIPESWGDNNALISGLSEALINGDTVRDGDEWRFDGEGNYGLYDSSVDAWLEWMRENAIPFIAASEAKYDYEGETIVFDGTNQWRGTSGVDNALLSQGEYNLIVSGKSQFRTIDEFFDILNICTLGDFPIDHLPTEFPKEDE